VIFSDNLCCWAGPPLADLRYYTCVFLLYHMHIYMYGVATIRRIPKITGLYCKRTSQKRIYCAKETSNFEELTNHSHPIYKCVHSLYGLLRVCNVTDKSYLSITAYYFWSAVPSQSPIAISLVSFLSCWFLCRGPWQNRPRELNHCLRFEI